MDIVWTYCESQAVQAKSYFFSSGCFIFRGMNRCECRKKQKRNSEKLCCSSTYFSYPFKGRVSDSTEGLLIFELKYTPSFSAPSECPSPKFLISEVSPALKHLHPVLDYLLYLLTFNALLTPQIFLGRPSRAQSQAGNHCFKILLLGKNV